MGSGVSRGGGEAAARRRSELHRVESAAVRRLPAQVRLLRMRHTQHAPQPHRPVPNAPLLHPAGAGRKASRERPHGMARVHSGPRRGADPPTGVFPLQQHATLVNALLVNAAVLLALLPATLHFLTLLFRDAFDSTALLTLLLRFERGRFLSHVTDYAGLQSLLLLLTLASVLAVGTGSLCRACRSWKRRETEETAVVVSGEPLSSRSSPSSWRRWLQGLKKKEDLDATLRLEWARLCMMVEACLCLWLHSFKRCSPIEQAPFTLNTANPFTQEQSKANENTPNKHTSHKWKCSVP